MPKLTTASKAGKKLTVNKAAPAIAQATLPGALTNRTPHIEIGYRLSGNTGDFRATITGGTPPLPIGPGRREDGPSSAYAGKILLAEHGLEADVLLVFRPMAR